MNQVEPSDNVIFRYKIQFGLSKFACLKFCQNIDISDNYFNILSMGRKLLVGKTAD